MSSDENERTNLLSGDAQPRYLFQSTVRRRRQRRVRQFQCCVCSIFLCAIVIFLVIAVSYGINEEAKLEYNDTVQNSAALLLTLSWPIIDVKQQASCIKDDYDWKEAMIAGEKALDERDEIEKNIPSLDLESPSYKHQKSFVASNRSRFLSRIEYVKENAQKYIYRYGNRTSTSNNCPKIQHMWTYNNNSITCEIFARFRSFDGTCNNLNHPLLYGVAFTPFRRALPPDYADGVSKPRVAKNGQDLPSARTVSVMVHRPIYRNDKKFTIMLAVWGQFIDHDLTATALTQGTEGKTIACCSGSDHPECFPVVIDSDDAYYGINNITCLEFVRSAAVPSNDDFGPREQLNQATSYLDGSVVYGSHINVTSRLREFNSGKLKMFINSNNKTLLPLSSDLSDGCNREEQNKIGRYCFMTGDQRANENLHLTSMHVIWARQHNYIATKLQDVNPHWDDERIFQESRKILAAQLQHITYNEFLKILIASQLLKKSELTPKTTGYYRGYDSDLDASIANSFAAAAFRFGHTLIPALIKFLKNDDTDPEYVQFHKMLFNPYLLYQTGGLDMSLRGAMNTTIEASDTYFNTEVKNHLFENRNKSNLCGLDLVSLNIQRGRDHGIPSYTNWRKHCGLKRPRSFSELMRDIDDDSLARIQTIYRNVEDIDLYTGALSEKPLHGGILGPTFTCLIVDQFVRIKKGDRFWYENPNPQSFKIEQLEEIRKTSLANIICDNSDNVEFVQSYVMQRVGEGNEYTPCIAVPRPDLTKWKDTDLPRVHISDNSISVKTVTAVDTFSSQ